MLLNERIFSSIMKVKVSTNNKIHIWIFTGLFIFLLAILTLFKTNFRPMRVDANGVSIKFQTGLAYGPHPLHRLDLCEPSRIQGQVAGVILIHGGEGDKSSFTSICKDLAHAGFVAVTINYREDPPPSYQVILPDIDLAVSWLTGKTYVDPNKLGTWGGSLGGYLASVLGTKENPGAVKCVSNNYGPTDFTDPNLESSPLKDEFLAEFFGGITLEQDPALYQNLSPVFNVSPADAPSWLFTRSTNDALVPRTQMDRMVSALNGVGLKTQVYEYAGTGGGHANRLPMLQARKLYNTRLDFMKNCLNSL